MCRGFVAWYNGHDMDFHKSGQIYTQNAVYWWTELFVLQVTMIFYSVYFIHDKSWALIQRHRFPKFTKQQGFDVESWLIIHPQKRRWAVRVDDAWLSVWVLSMNSLSTEWEQGFELEFNVWVKYLRIWNENNTARHNFYNAMSLCLK